MKDHLLFVIIQQKRFFLLNPQVQQILTLVSPDGRSWRDRSMQGLTQMQGRRAERQKAGAEPHESLAEDEGTVSPGHFSPAAWCPQFLSHSCALTSLLGVTEHRRGASAAMRSTNESFLTRCRSCVASPNGWGVTARPPWSICRTKCKCQHWGGGVDQIPPPDPFLPTTYCGWSGAVTLRCSRFCCLLKSARDNQEYLHQDRPLPYAGDYLQGIDTG